MLEIYLSRLLVIFGDIHAHTHWLWGPGSTQLNSPPPLIFILLLLPCQLLFAHFLNPLQFMWTAVLILCASSSSVCLNSSSSSCLSSFLILFSNSFRTSHLKASCAIK